MKQLQDPQYHIPQWALDAAIEGLQDLSRRLEDDAAAFAKVDTPEGLEKAWEYRKAHEFFIHL